MTTGGSSNFETIIYEVERGRARIALNRPAKMNAISQQMQEELHAAFLEADTDNRVHVVILRGNGRSFCAGYDITPRPAAEVDPNYRNRVGFDNDVWHLERSQWRNLALFDMHKPVIAQVHGYCLAGANDYALSCDIIIAADDARFGVPPNRAMGVVPNQMWLYHLGPQWAKRLVLTGDMISGADAAKIGLVLKSVPAELLEDEVEGLADRMALIDPDLLSANKRIVNLGLELMGARTLQRLGAEADARGHLVGSAAEFSRISREQGLRAALAWRDGKFGGGMARLEPEGRPLAADD